MIEFAFDRIEIPWEKEKILLFSEYFQQDFVYSLVYQVRYSNVIYFYIFKIPAIMLGIHVKNNALQWVGCFKTKRQWTVNSNATCHDNIFIFGSL